MLLPLRREFLTVSKVRGQEVIRAFEIALGFNLHPSVAISGINATLGNVYDTKRLSFSREPK